MLAVGRFPRLCRLGHLFLLGIVQLAFVVDAVPTLSFPINSQVPPVARIGQLFSFDFALDTFTSPVSSLSYSLVEAPSWLSLDSANRRLYGTPQDGDIASETVVGVPIGLVASDATGWAWDNATLVVSRNPGPQVQVPISEQIQAFGNYSEPASVLLSPDAEFRFDFAIDTFADAQTPVLNYYTVMSNNSPLPAWLSFNPSNLEFAGTTPPFGSLVEPPQTFHVKLIASDVTGFSAVSVDFSIVVSTHSLTTSDPYITLNATAGNLLVYDGLAKDIDLDGSPVDPTQLSVTTQALPSWLTFDRASWNISGTVPADAQSAVFAVTVTDVHQDVLNVTFSVEVTNQDSFFQSALPSLNVIPGGTLFFNLSEYLKDPTSLDVSTDIEPAVAWLSWHPDILTLAGDVPVSSPESMINVTFTVQPKGYATVKRAGTSQSQQLIIDIQPAPTFTSSAITALPTASQPVASSTSTSTSKSSKSKGPNWTIVAIVICVVAAFALIACITFCICSKKNKRQSQRSDTDSNTNSAPLPENLIYTPGVEVGPPNHPGGSTLSEKDKAKPRKPSNLRSELSPSPAPGVPSLADVYSNEHTSDMSMPPGRLRSWYDSLRRFRVAHLQRADANPRASLTFLSDDESAHHDLEPEYSHPSVGTFRKHSQGPFFRNNVELGMPTPPNHDGSLQRTLDRPLEGSPGKGKNIAFLPTPETSSGGLNMKDSPFSDMIHGQTTTPSLDQKDPFNPKPAPKSSPAHLVDEFRSGSGTTGPSSFYPASSRRLRPVPDFQLRTQPALRPSNSHKSMGSNSSIDSMRGRTKRLAAKASAQAKGAMSLATIAMKPQTRRTLARFGKKPSMHVRSKKVQRGTLDSSDDDYYYHHRPGQFNAGTYDEPEDDDEGDMFTESGRHASAQRGDSQTPSMLVIPSGSSRSGGRSGIGAFLSPRLWPQPASRAQSSAAPQTSPTSPPDSTMLHSERNYWRKNQLPGSASASSGGSRHSVRRFAQRFHHGPIRRRPVGSAPASSAHPSKVPPIPPPPPPPVPPPPPPPPPALVGTARSSPGDHTLSTPLQHTPLDVGSDASPPSGLGITTVYDSGINTSPFQPSVDEDHNGSWVTSQDDSSELRLSMMATRSARSLASRYAQDGSVLGSRSAQSVRRPGTAGTGSLGPNWVMYEEADESRGASAGASSGWQAHSGGSGSGGAVVGSGDSEADMKDDPSLSKPSVGEGVGLQHGLSGSGQSELSRQSEASSHVRAFV
ncbi:hypothetical protein BD289DRAFT_51482 [Coniella lustricola]|uniref:Dystroglycan-type cadherin-like domain-containing protein n=1 Tax=Coniella lustricola TaxID=2025994 RepID=A0A2T3A1B6_9PEZI|nr:hypothetical protein BD289DRAFT_51482 [Coniella lustricola]